MESQVKKRSGPVKSDIVHFRSSAIFKLVLWLQVFIVASYVCSASKIYRKLGQGSCGASWFNCSVRSNIQCAAICSQSSGCNSFSFVALPSFGTCGLHSNAFSPDGQENTVCYVPNDWQLTTSSSTITTEVTSTASTTSTASSTTITSTTAGTASAAVTPVDVTNLNTAPIASTQPCNGNAGAVGIYEDNSGFYLLCMNAPNGYSYQADNPSTQCSGNQMGCMTVSCPSKSAIRGFNSQNGGTAGPCSAPNDRTKLDTTDCHTISGAMQTRPTNKASWIKWRLCDGSKFYVMTASSVTSSGASWDLTSITCCLGLP
ncbi:uncharacterized protein LOC135224382 [Macrobrachium nipponense]|uniref:uncharacterized protein LOC135224382 n=1 Tax=Macrobrachium nipponense TaxID=159736 RepID=UPI0030C7B240